MNTNLKKITAIISMIFIMLISLSIVSASDIDSNNETVMPDEIETVDNWDDLYVNNE